MSKTQETVQLETASEQALPVEESGSKRLRYSSVIIWGVLWMLLLVGFGSGMRAAEVSITEILIVLGVLSLVPVCLAMLVLLGVIKVGPPKKVRARWSRDLREEDPSGYRQRYTQWGIFFDD